MISMNASQKTTECSGYNNHALHTQGIIHPNGHNGFVYTGLSNTVGLHLCLKHIRIRIITKYIYNSLYC